jgi:hypothetical protein
LLLVPDPPPGTGSGTADPFFSTDPVEGTGRGTGVTGSGGKVGFRLGTGLGSGTPKASVEVGATAKTSRAAAIPAPISLARARLPNCPLRIHQYSLVPRLPDSWYIT